MWLGVEMKKPAAARGRAGWFGMVTLDEGAYGQVLMTLNPLKLRRCQGQVRASNKVDELLDGSRFVAVSIPLPREATGFQIGH